MPEEAGDAEGRGDLSPRPGSDGRSAEAASESRAPAGASPSCDGRRSRSAERVGDGRAMTTTGGAPAVPEAVSAPAAVVETASDAAAPPPPIDARATGKAPGAVDSAVATRAMPGPDVGTTGAGAGAGVGVDASGAASGRSVPADGNGEAPERSILTGGSDGAGALARAARPAPGDASGATSLLRTAPGLEAALTPAPAPAPAPAAATMPAATADPVASIRGRWSLPVPASAGDGGDWLDVLPAVMSLGDGAAGAGLAVTGREAEPDDLSADERPAAMSTARSRRSGAVLPAGAPPLLRAGTLSMPLASAGPLSPVGGAPAPAVPIVPPAPAAGEALDAASGRTGAAAWRSATVSPDADPVRVRCTTVHGTPAVPAAERSSPDAAARATTGGCPAAGAVVVVAADPVGVGPATTSAGRPGSDGMGPAPDSAGRARPPFPPPLPSAPLSPMPLAVVPEETGRSAARIRREAGCSPARASVDDATADEATPVPPGGEAASA